MAIPLTARLPVPFYPPALLSRNDKIAEENVARAERGEEPLSEINIMVRVPTPFERDSFSSALVRGGVIHYTQKQIRDLMLAGVGFLYEEDQFDQVRSDLEGLWAAGDSAAEAHRRRVDLYLELMERRTAALKENPRAKVQTEEEIENELEVIQPEIKLPEAQRVRVTAIQQDITARYEPLQKAFADLSEQDIKRAWLCVEIYVINWHGLEFKPSGNGRGGITREEAEWLRGQIGAAAFDELAQFIFAMHQIDEDEEKNLASLIENYSAPSGSRTAGSMASNEGGPSTDEPTITIPEAASPRTTEPSSGSTTNAETKTVKSRRGPTGKRSSTSPSS